MSTVITLCSSSNIVGFLVPMKSAERRYNDIFGIRLLIGWAPENIIVRHMYLYFMRSVKTNKRYRRSYNQITTRGVQKNKKYLQISPNKLYLVHFLCSEAGGGEERSGNKLIVEVGPRLSFESAVSSNAKSICRASGVEGVTRFEVIFFF